VQGVRDMLTKTATYVRATANGDGVILANSGFDMAKVAQPIGLPGMPDNLKVLMGAKAGGRKTCGAGCVPQPATR